jgi:hypothetical protein
MANPKSFLNWAKKPHVLPAAGEDGFQNLPRLSRRCTHLTQTMLQVAFGIASDPAECKTVFASRHGSIDVSVGLLRGIFNRELTSPLQFSFSVHNAQAGQYSIAAQTRMASSSLAAGRASFGHGFLEAILLLHRRPWKPVLFVTADDVPPPPFDVLTEEASTPYALALLLEREPPGIEVGLQMLPPQVEGAPLQWPDAMEFLRWLLSAEDSLTLGDSSHVFRFLRSPKLRHQAGASE